MIALLAKLTLPRLPLNVLIARWMTWMPGWSIIERIVGGTHQTHASPNEFPYQISLIDVALIKFHVIHLLFFNFYGICGASIYKSGCIITAVHYTDG